MRYLLLTLLISITTYSNALAWTEPVRITYDANGYIFNQATAVGETLHVVAGRLNNVVYLFSSDNGRNWSDPIVLKPDSLESAIDPDIIYSKGRLHVAYIGYPYIHPGVVFHASSSDGGRSWSNTHIVYNQGSSMLKYPRLAANGDTLFLSCYTDQLQIYRSFDYGEHWEQAAVVESGPISVDQTPQIMFSLGRLIYIYQLALPLEHVGLEVYCRYSDDLGSTWSERIALSTVEPSPNVRHSQAPSAAVGGDGTVMAIWFDYKYGSLCNLDGDILGRVSYDNGSTWEPEMRLTYTESGSGSDCLILGNILYAVWMDDSMFGCLSNKIMFSQSFDYGQNWSTPLLISGQEQRITDQGPVLFNSINQDDTTLHCIFQSNTYGKLYYTRSHDFVSTWDGGNGQVLPEELSLGAYPNPFNSSVILTLENPKGGDVEIAIYDLLGKKVREFTLNGAKEGQIEWDAGDAQGNKVSSGLYFARASTPRQSQTIRLIYLK